MAWLRFFGLSACFMCVLCSWHFYLWILLTFLFSIVSNIYQIPSQVFLIKKNKKLDIKVYHTHTQMDLLLLRPISTSESRSYLWELFRGPLRTIVKCSPILLMPANITHDSVPCWLLTPDSLWLLHQCPSIFLSSILLFHQAPQLLGHLLHKKIFFPSTHI